MNLVRKVYLYFTATPAVIASVEADLKKGRFKHTELFGNDGGGYVLEITVTSAEAAHDFSGAMAMLNCRAITPQRVGAV